MYLKYNYNLVKSFGTLRQLFFNLKKFSMQAYFNPTFNIVLDGVDYDTFINCKTTAKTCKS